MKSIRIHVFPRLVWLAVVSLAGAIALLADLWQAICGRTGLTDAGRCYFEDLLRWTKASELVAEITGNTVDSGMDDSTETRFRYHGISAGHLRAIVMTVYDLQRAPAKAKRD